MSKKNRQRRAPSAPTPFEQARDELFQQIMRCDVIGADPEHQAEWFGETMAYFAERYPELTAADVKDLRTLGERFVQPPKAATVEETAAEPVSIGTPSEESADDAAAVAELVDESATVAA